MIDIEPDDFAFRIEVDVEPRRDFTGLRSRPGFEGEATHAAERGTMDCFIPLATLGVLAMTDAGSIDPNATRPRLRRERPSLPLLRSPQKHRRPPLDFKQDVRVQSAE